MRVTSGDVGEKNSESNIGKTLKIRRVTGQNRVQTEDRKAQEVMKSDCIIYFVIQ